jgi:amino acid adenylation domain-containing protein
MQAAQLKQNNAGAVAHAPGQCWPLSAAQQGVWVAQQLDPTNPRFNCGGYLEIHGAVDAVCLQAAVQQALGETDALRLRFIDDGEQVVQTIDPLPVSALSIRDVSLENEPAMAAESSMKADLAQTVDLTHSVLYQHVLFTLSANRFFFYVRYHHILLDGYGQAKYWTRIAAIYNALLAKQAVPATSFAALATLLDEEADYRGAAQFVRDGTYWRDSFSVIHEPARLSGIVTLPARNLLRRISVLDQAMIARLRSATQRTGTRWSVLALAATAAYMRRMTGLENVVLGLPVTSRTTPAARETPAMMANELPLCLRLDGALTLTQLLRHVSGQVGRVLMHQRYRGEDLHHALKLSGTNQKLTGPTVNVISFDHKLHFGPHATTPHYLSSGPITDLLLGFYGTSDGSELQIYFDANPDLYTAEVLAQHQRRFLGFFARFLEADGDQLVDALDLLGEDEHRQLAGFNATVRAYDLSCCLHQLIDQQALRSPDAVALATADGSVTYRQLREDSNRLAAHLVRCGVQVGQRVGVYALRSPEMVIGMLAIMKAGAAYVPLDPELPLARLTYQLENAAITLVLSSASLQAQLASMPVQVLAVDQLLPALAPADCPQLPTLHTRHAAYVIYTSGSTGQPKGVEVPHCGIVNRLLWMQDAYRLDAAETVLQKTPFNFDVSVWEFFWPLLVGARLFLAAPEMHRDPRYVARLIGEQHITTLHFVPTMLDLFLAEPESDAAHGLRRVVCSGEALHPETVAAFFQRFGDDGPQLLNLYGPTEASVDVTAWRCRPQDAHGLIPIGAPIANTQMYVLDHTGVQTPIGVAGELYIGGVQVANGYVNQPALTAERFVDNPFAAGRMYRTGDLARYRADGVLEYLGRLDHQVKLRGFRIELGEIESALLTHPTIRQAVVTVWERSAGERRLVAYVTPHRAGDIVQEDLLAALAAQLPEYMVPAHLVVLDALPLLINGKIDRRALPAPQVAQQGERTFPGSKGEHFLFRAWKTVFGHDQFGIDDSFFALGGDSMLSIRSRASLEQSGLTFSVQDLFRYPTIRLLAPHLQSVTGAAKRQRHSAPFSLVSAADRALLPDGLEDAYPLSAMQAGMLFHADFDERSAVYRVVTSLHVAAAFDRAALLRALEDTFSRHPALRSGYDLSTYSEPLQLIHRAVTVPLVVMDDIGVAAASAQARVSAWIAEAKYHQFDVTLAPLLQFVIHPRGAASFQLSVIEHHVVLDGWSDAAMLEEIIQRYRAYLSGEEWLLPAVGSYYRDFVAEERRVAADPDAQQFWRQVSQGAEPSWLPRKTIVHGDSKDTTQQAFDAPLPPGLGDELRSLARREGLPLKSLLAVAHLAVLRQVCNANEILTGVISNGRLEEADGDEVIGVFLNTLPLRVDTDQGDLLQLAHQVFAQERDGAPFRRYPFAQMQRDAALQGDQLQLDSYVNFMDFHLQWQVEKDDDTAIMESIGVAETNVPLAANFLIDPVHNRLRLWLDCDIALLDAAFCQRLTGYYQRALQAMVSQPHARMQELDLIGAGERGQIARWNENRATYDRHTTIDRQIAAQAAATPAAVALVHRWQQLSYAELDAQANRLAHQLRQCGVGRGQLVGVSLRRSNALVIALLAVMKAGAAYVPLDPGFPKNRLEFIAADAAIHCLVTDCHGPLDMPVAHRILIDRDAAHIAAQPGTALRPDPARDAHGDDAAYVIYTSGSTGLPKGTPVRHRNVSNFFVGMDRTIGCGVDDALLALTSVSFDISVLELLWPLCRGAQVVIAGERLIHNLVRTDAAGARTMAYRWLDAAGGAQAAPAAEVAGHPALVSLAVTSDQDAFAAVGAAGHGIVTALVGHSLAALRAKIDAYRQQCAQQAQGQPSGLGRVVVQLPVLLLDDAEQARTQARAGLRQYLRDHAELHPLLFAEGGSDGEFGGVLPDDDLESGVERYAASGLFGSAASCLDLLRELALCGVDALVCEHILDQPGLREASASGVQRLFALYADEIAEAQHTFVDLCARHPITIMQSTPSFLAAVAADPQALAALGKVRAILVGGEAFPVGLAARVAAALPAAHIWNMYGPTETTIWSTVHALDRVRDLASNLIPIGKAIANTELYVWDAARRALPIGVAGELWIGGDGVAGVYLGRPEMTAERFPQHPQGAGQVYRTGDRVRWRDDGALEFLGRVDRQVKILGHRIEPDEVESVLSLHPQVAAVAVIAVTKENGSAELVAFVAPKANLADDAAEQVHVQRWGAVWDGAYTDIDTGTVEDDDPDRDFAGWLSSYDNRPIPPVQMREWLTHTIARIDALHPRRMLDVGVGVGLFLREFGPRVAHYTGFDVAPGALRQAAASLKMGPVLPPHIELVLGDAGRLAQLPDASVDTVIINSVIQYFPGTDYLQRVLLQAARVAGPQGAVFVGDVRHLDLLEAFHATAQLQRAPALMPAREIASALARQMAAEGELCLTPHFFHALAAESALFGAPRLELKRGMASNELTCFRFDVVLPGCERVEPSPQADALSWADVASGDGARDVASLAQHVQGRRALCVTGIPNQRLVRPLKLVQLLRQASASAIAWDLHRALWEADDGRAVAPEAVAQLGESLGYRVRLLLSADGRMDEFDAVFELVDAVV